MFQISIMGDTVCTDSNRNEFIEGNVDCLLGDGIRQIIDQSDVCVFNLEAPITGEEESIFKPGAPCIKSPIGTEHFFENLRTRVVLSCANNHIKDFGIKGIKDTINYADSAGLSIVGVSYKNSEEARIPVIVRANDGQNIGIYSCAEHEFSIASSSEGGANGFDLIDSINDVKRMKQECSNVIVLFHAGRENYRYPSCNLQRRCRLLIDAGASIVICQHSHCIGCQEKYKNGTIVYGQGNFLFDRLNIEGWNSGLIITLSFDKNELNNIEYHPVVKHENCVRLATNKTRDSLLNAFEERSRECLDIKLLEQNWKRFCSEQLSIFVLQGVYGVTNRYILALDRKFGFFLSKWLMGGVKHRKLLLNFIRCESIHESFETILNNDDIWK